MVDFDFLEEYLGIVFPPHFVNNFARKMFLMMYSVNTKFICLIAFSSADICALQLFFSQLTKS